MQDELLAGTYASGAYRTFEIFEPKRRLISAAPIRDRVVHHALCGVLERVFEPTFVFDSYACRRGKGTHAALDRFRDFARRHRYVLQCDVRKFFPSVDQEILKQLIARTQDGSRFLGFRQFPDYRLVARENIQRMRRRLRRMCDAFQAGELSAAQVRERIISWIGHVRHADSYRLRERLFHEFAFVRESPPPLSEVDTARG